VAYGIVTGLSDVGERVLDKIQSWASVMVLYGLFDFDIKAICTPEKNRIVHMAMALLFYL